MLNFEWVGLILLNIMLLLDQLGFLFFIRLHIRRFLLLFFILDFRLFGEKGAISSSSVPAVFFAVLTCKVVVFILLGAAVEPHSYKSLTFVHFAHLTCLHFAEVSLTFVHFTACLLALC